MNKQERAQNVVNEFIKLSLQLDKNQKWWIFNIALPEYFCFECGEDLTDCECQEK